MRIKNLVLSLALGLTVAAVGAGTVIAHVNEEPLTVAADKATGTYGFAGSFINPETGSEQGWNPSALVPFTYNEAADQMQLVLEMKAGDEFKFLYNPIGSQEDPNACWDGYGQIQIPNLNPDYFETWDDGNTSRNQKCTVDGTYLFTLANGIDTYGTKGYGLQGGNPVDVEKVTVTLMNGDEVVREDVVNAGSTYNPGFVFVDGMVNEGWYTNADLTTPYVPTAIEADLTLYGKYVPAPADYEIYYEGEFTNAYYRGLGGAAPAAFPGAPMTLVETPYISEKPVYRITIQTEYQASEITFAAADGKTQTENLDLTGASAVYGDEGILADSSDKLAALAFLEHYKTLRTNHEWEGEPLKNSICWIIGDNAAWTELKGLYEAITNTTLVDGVADLDGTIGETMAYLYSRIGGAPEGNLPIAFNNDDDTAMIVSLSIVGGLFVIVALGAVLFAKRKRAR